MAVSTAKNWKGEIAGHQKNVSDLTKKLAQAKTQAELAGKVLEDAKVAFEQGRRRHSMPATPPSSTTFHAIRFRSNPHENSGPHPTKKLRD